jgi:hypothetical protein
MWRGPVHLVFEFNRFSVVHAVDDRASTIAGQDACRASTALPLAGPTLLSLRPNSRTINENGSMRRWRPCMGAPLAARPDLWQPYPALRWRMFSSLPKPATRAPERASPPEAAAISTKSLAQRRADSVHNVVYLPIVGRKVGLDRLSWIPVTAAHRGLPCHWTHFEDFIQKDQIGT